MMEGKFKSSRLLTLAVLAGISIGMSGCATTGDRDKLQAEIDQVKAEAASASRDAAEAKSMAADAMATANEARATSDATEEKIDRMFKKSMYK